MKEEASKDRQATRVAVIIVAFNSADKLPDCLASLSSQRLPGDIAMDVIVVDNASSDGSADMARSLMPDAHVIESEENTGFAGGNNIGMKHALDSGYDYVVLLNDDTITDPYWLRELVSAAGKDPKAGAIQSLIMLWPDTGKVNTWGNEAHFLGYGYGGGGYQGLPRERDELRRRIAYPSGASVLLRPEALRQVGLLDENFFMYHEDFDLGMRLHLAGWDVVCEPRSVVWHKYEFSRSIKKLFWMERNRFVTWLALLKPATLAVIFPAFIVMELGSLGFALRGGWATDKLRAYRVMVAPVGWRQISRKRRHVQGLRRRKDSHLAELFTGVIESQDVSNPLLDRVANPVMKAYWSLARRLILW